MTMSSGRASTKVVTEKYQGLTAFMFRLANTRDSELFDVHAEVAIARRRTGGSIKERLFELLNLERHSVNRTRNSASVSINSSAVTPHRAQRVDRVHHRQ
jgi:hypothetical protein